MSAPKPINILLVEDDEVDVQSVQRAFKKYPLAVQLHIANDGLQALSMLLNEATRINPAPKLIILDINMPKMNGIEFLKQLRADPNLKETSVLILTTSNNDNDKIAALDLNVNGYILKPLQPDYFLAHCSVLLGNITTLND